MVTDIQNPAQQRSGSFTHTAVLGVTAKNGGSDHVGATAGVGANNYVLFKVAPGDVLKRAVLIDLLEVYVGAGSGATSVALVWGTAADGTGGTVVGTMTDIRSATPKTAVSTTSVDYVNAGATDLYIAARYTGAAGATLASSTKGLVGISLEILRKVDRFPQAYN